MHFARQPNHCKVSDSTGGDNPDRRETRQRAWAIPRFSKGWFHVIICCLTLAPAALAQDASLQPAHAFLESALLVRDLTITETSLAFTVNECVNIPQLSSETYCVDVRQTVDLRGFTVKKTLRRHWFHSGVAILVASAHPVRRDLLNLNDYPDLRVVWVDLRLRASRAGRRRAWLFLKDGVSPDQVGQALQALAR